MQAFNVIGTFKMGPNKAQPFTLQYAADSEDAARERAYSELGSKHRTARNNVHIEKVDKVANDKVTDVRVAHALGIDLSQ